MQASCGVSERRVCGVFPADRPTIRHNSRRPDRASLEMLIKDLAATRVLYGYRRIHVLLLEARMADQPQKDPADLPGTWPSAAQPDTQAQGEGGATGRQRPRSRAQRALVDGLPVRPAVRSSQDPGSVDRQQLHLSVCGLASRTTKRLRNASSVGSEPSASMQTGS